MKQWDDSLVHVTLWMKLPRNWPSFLCRKRWKLFFKAWKGFERTSLVWRKWHKRCWTKFAASRFNFHLNESNWNQTNFCALNVSSSSKKWLFLFHEKRMVVKSVCRRVPNAASESHFEWLKPLIKGFLVVTEDLDSALKSMKTLIIPLLRALQEILFETQRENKGHSSRLKFPNETDCTII